MFVAWFRCFVVIYCLWLIVVCFAYVGVAVRCGCYYYGFVFGGCVVANCLLLWRLCVVNCLLRW